MVKQFKELKLSLTRIQRIMQLSNDPKIICRLPRNLIQQNLRIIYDWLVKYKPVCLKLICTAISIGVILLAVACTSSSISSIEKSPDTCKLDLKHKEKLLVQAVVDRELVEAGWMVHYLVPDRFSDALSSNGGYSHPEMPKVGGAISLDIFDTEESAQAYFQKRVNEVPAKPIYPQVAFSSVSDEHTTVCYETDIRLNFTYTRCLSFIRYGCAVVRLRQDTFPDKWVTLQDYERMLQRTEDRFVAGLTSEENNK